VENPRKHQESEGEVGIFQASLGKKSLNNRSIANEDIGL
jgi:hypothetical protein